MSTARGQEKRIYTHDLQRTLPDLESAYGLHELLRCSEVEDRYYSAV